MASSTLYTRTSKKGPDKFTAPAAPPLGLAASHASPEGGEGGEAGGAEDDHGEPPEDEDEENDDDIAEDRGRRGLENAAPQREDGIRWPCLTVDPRQVLPRATRDANAQS